MPRRTRCARSWACRRGARAPDRRRVRAARADHVLHGARGVRGRARSLPRGATAWDAAGKVHSDIQSGFVRAEVIPWDQLVDAGGYAAARERALLRTEGREYAVQDGDVITIRS